MHGAYNVKSTFSLSSKSDEGNGRRQCGTGCGYTGMVYRFSYFLIGTEYGKIKRIHFSMPYMLCVCVFFGATAQIWP